MAYLKDTTGPLLDPVQFAYRANRSVDDAVNMGLQFILQHLDRPGTYVRVLFVDFSSAFNTIIPDTLQNKLTQLSVPTSICQWINSFLTDRQQLVRLGKFSSSTSALPPLTIMNSTVTAVESFRFLGNTISQDLKWDNHIVSIVKNAQQRLYFLRQLRKFNLPQELLKQFYSAIIESVLCTSITVWFSSATKSDLRRLRRVVRTAERIIGTTLPTLQELYLSRVSKRADKITLDPSHQAHSLFELLPSGRRYRALCTRTTRHRNIFFPQAVHLMNT